MSKSVLISIQPYWFFLIIAESMGWYIGKVKTEEIRKNFPKDSDWDRIAIIYCSKDKKSFNRIPKEYQPLMQKFLGKVVGKWFCDSIEMVNAKCSAYGIDLFYHDCMTQGCLTEREIDKYFNIPEDKDLRVMKGNGYAWHISNLKIYDKPKELSEFFTPMGKRPSYMIERPPQSWCYVEAD